MRSGVARRVLVSLALVLLTAVTASEAAEASLRIVWRFAVLSFDYPATLAIDELVSVSSPTSDAGAEARRSTRLAVGTWRPLAPLATPVAFSGIARLSGITRAPPAR
jgi:hypothetical protein